MKIPSHMMSGHQFSQVPSSNIERSQFNRSHGLKTTFDSGYLIPVLVDEVLPGDTYVVKMTALARLATPLKPLMDNMYLDSFFFFVPYRLVWNNFQKFMGEQTDPGDSVDFRVPQQIVPAPGYQIGGIHDYMGLPVAVGNTQSGPYSWSHSALPLRAYNLIWNEWFRDQNLQDSYEVKKDDGPDDGSIYGLFRRGKRHDYFTSCLPWPQKGTMATLPIGAEAPVIPDPNSPYPLFRDPAQGMTNPLNPYTGALVQGTTYQLNVQGAQSPTGPVQVAWHTTGLVADLAEGTSITINALRQAFQIQKLLERDARGGTRYTELVRSHFGVVSPDARLQRPEYLGGGSSPVVISPIAQTSASGTYADSPQGNLAAIGTSHVSGHGFAKSFTEHGIIIGLISARADLTYQQGIERQWIRSTKYDFYWPALAHIGEQAVYNAEIFTADNYVQNIGVFGYQERFAEYRYKPSKVTGKFRSAATDSLDIWHLAQDFGALPTLNDSFIQETPPVERVVATPDEPEFLLDAYFDMKCARPMPVFGVPGLIDHF